MTLINAMNKVKNNAVAASNEWKEGINSLVIMLAPIAPHISEELWHRLGNTDSVHLEAWPEYDDSALIQDSINMAVQVNGKVRAQIEVPADADKDAILAIAKADENVARYLASGNLVREIVVPGKLVNLVVKG